MIFFDSLMVIFVIVAIAMVIYYGVTENITPMHVAFTIMFLLCIALLSLLYIDNRTPPTTTHYKITITSSSHPFHISMPKGVLNHG